MGREILLWLLGVPITPSLFCWPSFGIETTSTTAAQCTLGEQHGEERQDVKRPFLRIR